MWAFIREDSKNYNDRAMKVESQAPEGYTLYVVQPDAGANKGEKDAAMARAIGVIAETLSTQKSSKFRPDAVQVWHLRAIPGNGVYISDNAWEMHPSYSGPADQRIYAYCPKLVEEKEAAVAQAKWAAEQRAKIQAKADAEKAAVDA